VGDLNSSVAFAAADFFLNFFFKKSTIPSFVRSPLNASPNFPPGWIIIIVGTPDTFLENSSASHLPSSPPHILSIAPECNRIRLVPSPTSSLNLGISSTMPFHGFIIALQC
jgi:hypothetical protein